MRRLVSAATAGALMLGTVMAGSTGASAAPITAAPLGKAPSASVDSAMVEQVRHRRHRGHRGAGIALGAAGLVLGLSALASRPRYYDDPYYYGGPGYAYGGPVGYGAEPWSPAWYDYCTSRYRSFDPSTGYFRRYDGGLQFCR